MGGSHVRMTVNGSQSSAIADRFLFGETIMAVAESGVRVTARRRDRDSHGLQGWQKVAESAPGTQRMGAHERLRSLSYPR